VELVVEEEETSKVSPRIGIGAPTEADKEDDTALIAAIMEEPEEDKTQHMVTASALSISNRTVSKKTFNFVIVHVFAKYWPIFDFFTGKFCGQVAVVWLLNISPHHNCVATLPCET